MKEAQHILNNSIYIKYHEQANPQRKKADEGLPWDWFWQASEGNGEWLLNGFQVCSGVMKILWNYRSVVAQQCDCTKCHWIVHFKIVNCIIWISLQLKKEWGEVLKVVLWVRNLTAMARGAAEVQVRPPAQCSGLKDLVLQLWLRFNPWPRNFHMLQGWP